MNNIKKIQTKQIFDQNKDDNGITFSRNSNTEIQIEH